MPPKGKATKNNKRARSPSASPGAAGESARLPAPSASKKARLNDGTALDVGANVEVVYELVGSDKTFKRNMGELVLLGLGWARAAWGTVAVSGLVLQWCSRDSGAGV